MRYFEWRNKDHIGTTEISLKCRIPGKNLQIKDEKFDTCGNKKYCSDRCNLCFIEYLLIYYVALDLYSLV